MSDLDALIEAVRRSSKYRHITPQVIERIGAAELARHKRPKEAIKATKNKLHQVSGAYLGGPLPYDAWREQLAADPGRTTCEAILHEHASTRERLPLLDTFYPALWAELGPVQHVIDLACGLNPLAWPWMGLPAEVRYDAYDLPEDMLSFVDDALTQWGVSGERAARDILSDPPTAPADVALLLKTIPCLEQLDKHAGRHLLATLPTRHAVVTFPVHSLGGRAKGMREHYHAQFSALLDTLPWEARSLSFDTELVFILTHPQR